MQVSVKQNDTLYKLLQERGVPKENLAKAAAEVGKLNNLEDVDKIKAGSTLTFPSSFTFGSKTINLTDGPSLAADFKAKTQGTQSGQSLGVLGQHAFTDTAQLSVLVAGMEALPEVDSSWPSVPGYEISTKEDNWKIDSPAKNAEGKAVQLEWDATQLIVNGKAILGPSQAEVDQTISDFKEEFSSPEAFEYNDFGWSSSSGLSPIGQAGQMLSVRESGSSYMGGAHPNNFSSLKTVDLRSGEVARLDQLLSAKQFDSVVKTVQKEFSKLPEDERFGFPELEEIRDVVADNFAMTKLDSGKVVIDVALRSYIHAASGMEFQVRLAAPETPEFRAAIGA